MKTAAVLVTLAIATLDLPLVQAAECTTDELTTISDIYSSAMSEGTASCPDLTMATDATTVDYCSNSDCMDFMSNMLDQLPDCSTSGVDLKAGLQAALDYCETGTADTSGILTGSSSIFATDSSSSSAFATDSSSSSDFTTDSSSSSAPTTASSSSSVFRTQSPSATSSATDTSSDKVTANTLPPATGGSSSASSTEMAISSAAFAVTAFMIAIGL
ncbi:hypothetical protein PRIC2_009547 [Phytophthora ramorum]